MAGKIEIFGKIDKKVLIFVKKISQSIAGELKIEKKNINIYFVSEKDIKEINRKFRQKDRPTTILTFGSQETKFIYPPKEDIFGEIIVCLSEIKKQSEEIGISLNDWLRKLLIHSFLHLLGYTHDDEKKAAIMVEKEKEVYKKLLKRYER